MQPDYSPDVAARTIGLARTIAPAAATPNLKSEDSLSEAGLTSMDLVNLMLAIETEFDIMIPPALLKPENFRTIAAISRMVEAVRDGRA